MTEPLTRRERRAAARATASRVLTPAVRRWAYGVAVAAIGVAVFAGWIPATASPVALPLIMALLYVDDSGEPR
ncbi:hypothetical protein MRBLWO14_001159 [Microbacterium sp. LWO14-1.2]|uniref:hypothetical protein n=1 Tax=Microbacterium sp. LWO14-1.2 TaxID=3135263 RepID=UPI003138985C